MLSRHNFSLRLIPVEYLKKSYVMRAINDREDDVIELGVASEETKDGADRPGSGRHPAEARLWLCADIELASEDRPNIGCSSR